MNFKNPDNFKKVKGSVSNSVVMKFSDDSGDNNQNRSDKNNTSSPQNKGFFPVIIAGIVLITIVVLILYFFVFRSSSSTQYYGDADVVYNIDTDGDGKADRTEKGTPDFSNYSGENLYDIVLTNDSDAPGSLASILLQPEIYQPSLNVVQLEGRVGAIVYLTGSYKTTDSNNKSITVNYQANLSPAYYENYVSLIVDKVKVKDSSNVLKNYYSSATGKYAFDIQSQTDTSWILPLLFSLVFGIALIVFLNRMFKSGGSSNPMAGFVNNVARKQKGSKTRFSDVAGCDEAKAELIEMVDYFHSTDKYTRLGAKLPHGVLLVGPPGTGKTLLAKAVAGEANVPFYSISGSDFVEMYVGVGASRVRSLFKTAKQNAPCLIFIDEIDAVGRQRGTGLGGGNDEREQTLNELLVEMDGFEDNNGVIVMAATNRSDVLDPALTRPGRFDRTITVDLPDKAGRSAILKVHSKNKTLASDVSFDSIASRTVGFSGADLANIMNDAAILAVRNNRSAITTADIDEAIDRAISGPAKKSHLEEHERKQVAYHEAGHAVIGIFLPYSDKVQKITIIPRGRTGGHVLMTPENDRFLMTKNQLLARITGYLGGRTSEEIFFGDVSTGASNDIEVATNIARGMVTEYGMSDLGPIQYEKAGGSVFLGRDYNSTQANYSTQIAYEIDKAIRSIIDECHEKCRQLLLEHKEDVELIAETLIQNETITADQIQYLLANRKLPPVDEHKIEEVKVNNPNNIILYAGYNWFYSSIDKILEGNPSRLVLVVATGNGSSIAQNSFEQACIKGAKDPSHIGMLFVEFARSMRVSTSIETFAEHLEAYAGVPVLLIKTDDNTVKSLKAKYEPKEVEKAPEIIADEKTDEVVKESEKEIKPDEPNDQDNSSNK